MRIFKGRFYSTTYWLFVLLPLVLTACNRPQTAHHEDRLPSRYFQETGYTVRGDLLYFFDLYGGPDSLGNPLTGELIIDGWQVQYFEKGRLEYHPENEPAYQITVGWLGDRLNRRQPPIPAANIPRAGGRDYRYYPQTGHVIRGDFLRYFDAHGGSVRFGLPISEPFLLEGQLTQDFQSARFFWTPQATEPVTLEEIGRIHLEKIKFQNKKLGRP